MKMMFWSLKDELNVTLNNCLMSIMYDMNHMLSWDEKIKNSKCSRLNEE